MNMAYSVVNHGPVNPVYLCALVVLLAFAWGIAQAQEKVDAKDDSSKSNSQEVMPEYGGVVVDQTLTGLGRYFYVSFSQSWSEKEDIDSFVVAIKERPSQRGGTEVMISTDEVVVFRSFLPRSYSAVDDMIYTAVDAVYTKLTQMRVDAALFNSNELAKTGY